MTQKEEYERIIEKYTSLITVYENAIAEIEKLKKQTGADYLTTVMDAHISAYKDKIKIVEAVFKDLELLMAVEK